VVRLHLPLCWRWSLTGFCVVPGEQLDPLKLTPVPQLGCNAVTGRVAILDRLVSFSLRSSNKGADGLVRRRETFAARPARGYRRCVSLTPHRSTRSRTDRPTLQNSRPENRLTEVSPPARGIQTQPGPGRRQGNSVAASVMPGTTCRAVQSSSAEVILDGHRPRQEIPCQTLHRSPDSLCARPIGSDELVDRQRRQMKRSDSIDADDGAFSTDVIALARFHQPANSR